MACALAADVQQLNEIRMSIRPRAEQSEMFDAQRFATWFEDQLTEICSETSRFPPAPSRAAPACSSPARGIPPRTS